MTSGDLRPNKAVDAAIAEYNALRAETVSHLNSQAAIAALSLTALGVIGGLTFGEHGDRRLLIVLPPLALVVSLLTTANYYRLIVLGTYIRESLWVFIAKEINAGLPSWEGFQAGQRENRLIRTCLELALQGPIILLLELSAALALIYVQADRRAVVVGWVCFTLGVLAPVVLVIWSKRYFEPAMRRLNRLNSTASPEV